MTPPGTNDDDVNDDYEHESDGDDTDTATLEVTREPFLAFVPKLQTWAGGIIGGEISTAGKAIVSFPSWSVAYLTETYEFYRAEPRTLFNEVCVVYHTSVSSILQGVSMRGTKILTLFVYFLAGTLRFDGSNHAGKLSRSSFRVESLMS